MRGGGQGREARHLSEEVDAVGDGVHGDRVAADKKATKVHAGQVVQPRVQAGQLPDVVADHVQETLRHVLLGELWNER